jgi:PKD domain
MPRRVMAVICAATFALALAVAAVAQDSPKELKKLDQLEGYDQLRGEKGVEKKVEAVPTGTIEKKIVSSEATPARGPAPLTVHFGADQLPNGVYTWSFGDGSAPAKGRRVTHTYTKPGRYHVLLKVTGAAGTLGESELDVEVTAQP